MKLAIMQPYLFPYIGYFQLVNAVDKFVILDDVNFISRGWINRNRILVNNQPHLFTVPLKQASQNRRIMDIEVSDEMGWKRKFLTMIEMNYRRAPFFNETYLLLENLFLQEEKFISKLIARSIFEIMSFLDVKTDLVESSAVYANGHIRSQDKILDICKKEKASQYINPIGGVELYSKERFIENGMTLNFIKTNEIAYRQFGNEFVPWLSMIDVLMFNSKDTVSKFINDYSLI